MVLESGTWVVDRVVSVSPNDTFNLQRMARKYQRKFICWELQDSIGKQLNEATCFEDVVEDGTFAIYLVPQTMAPLSSLKRPHLNRRE